MPLLDCSLGMNFRLRHMRDLMLAGNLRTVQRLWNATLHVWVKYESAGMSPTIFYGKFRVHRETIWGPEFGYQLRLFVLSCLFVLCSPSLFWFFKIPFGWIETPLVKALLLLAGELFGLFWPMWFSSGVFFCLSVDTWFVCSKYMVEARLHFCGDGSLRFLEILFGFEFVACYKPEFFFLRRLLGPLCLLNGSTLR